jgi:hypothetical protein
MRAAPLLAGCLLSAWLVSTAGDAPTLLIKVHYPSPLLTCTPVHSHCMAAEPPELRRAGQSLMRTESLQQMCSFRKGLSRLSPPTLRHAAALRHSLLGTCCR